MGSTSSQAGAGRHPGEPFLVPTFPRLARPFVDGPTVWPQPGGGSPGVETPPPPVPPKQWATGQIALPVDPPPSGGGDPDPGPGPLDRIRRALRAGQDWLVGRALPAVRSGTGRSLRAVRERVARIPLPRPVRATDVIGVLVAVLVIGCLVLAFLRQDLLRPPEPMSVGPTPQALAQATSSPSADVSPGLIGDPTSSTQPTTGPASASRPVGASGSPPTARSAPTSKPATPSAHRSVTPTRGVGRSTAPVQTQVDATIVPVAPQTTQLTLISVACSRTTSLRSVRVTFVNTSNRSLELDWSSYSCNLTRLATIRPGGSATVLTYPGHSWAFVDPDSGQTLGSRTIDGWQTSYPMP